MEINVAIKIIECVLKDIEDMYLLYDYEKEAFETLIDAAKQYEKLNKCVKEG